jgi:RNA polymerase sigma factor (sigma-70 family)
VAQTKSENFGLAELEVALERLDDAERSLVFLKHVEGLKCREIAALTGQPLGTVTGNLARTYRKLRRSLQAGRGGA